jgi:mono/diheme cytochrome c family protein
MVARRTLAILMAGAWIVASVPLLAEQTPPAEPPPGPGLDLIQRSCINCHDIYMITAKRRTAQEWATVVGLMADRGAEVTPEEMQIIEDYLSQNFSAH